LGAGKYLWGRRNIEVKREIGDKAILKKKMKKKDDFERYDDKDER